MRSTPILPESANGMIHLACGTVFACHCDCRRNMAWLATQKARGEAIWITTRHESFARLQKAKRRAFLPGACVKKLPSLIELDQSPINLV
jgi:hypothetical protein